MVKSADRTCQILSLIGQNKNGLRHSKIAETLEIPLSSLSGLLSSLVAHQFISFDPVSQTYALGPQILALAGVFLDGLDVVEYARPIVIKLSRDTGESAGISIRMNQYIIGVFKSDSLQPVKGTVPIGMRAPLHATASGKAILANLPKKEIEDYIYSVELSPITLNTITDVQVLHKELDEIRSSGFAFNREEMFDQIIAIATPVFDLYGDVVASVVITIPTTRFNDKIEVLLKQNLKEASNAISYKLGYKGQMSALNANLKV